MFGLGYWEMIILAVLFLVVAVPVITVVLVLTLMKRSKPPTEGEVSPGKTKPE